jgi:hypothetical protein
MYTHLYQAVTAEAGRVQLTANNGQPVYAGGCVPLELKFLQVDISLVHLSL